MSDLISSVQQHSTWLALALALGAIISGLVAFSAFRQARTGFFALVRETSRRRAQRAGLLSVMLLALCLALGVLPRLAGAPQPVAEAPAPSATPTRARLAAGSTLASRTPLSVVEPTVAAPGTTATVSPTAEAALVPTPSSRAGSPFAPPVFCRGVTEKLNPIDPGQVFSASSEPIYALFSFAGMTNGQSWTQVWLRDGEEFKRRQDTWRWGPTGAAYVSAAPAGGYQAGTYLVQFFIGDELVSSGQFTVQQ